MDGLRRHNGRYGFMGFGSGVVFSFGVNFVLGRQP